MRTLFTNETLAIPARTAVSGIAVPGHMLRILRGRVWVTVEGNRHDYFLHAGDSFSAEPGRLVVVEADLDAAIALRRTHPSWTLESAQQWFTALVARWTKVGNKCANLAPECSCSDACC